MSLRSMPPRVSDYILFIQALIFKQKYITVLSYVDFVRNIYWIKIFNFIIQFIWLNATYIIRNLGRTIFSIYRAIGKTLCYYKRAFIWRFMLVYSVVSEHYFVYDYIIIVEPIFILLGVIFINLYLFLMTY